MLTSQQAVLRAKTDHPELNLSNCAYAQPSLVSRDHYAIYDLVADHRNPQLMALVNKDTGHVQAT